MFQTIILILVNVFGIYITVKESKKRSTASSINMKTFLTTVYLMGLFIPLFEEAFFRGILKQYLADIPFNNIINGLLFGLTHIHNYVLTKSLYITAIQVLSTSYLGYYLVQLDSFMMSYFVHCLYNINIFAFSYLILYITYKLDKDSGKPVWRHDDFDNDDMILSSVFSSIHYCPFTQDDMLYQKNSSKNRLISRKRVPADIIERIDKLVIAKRKCVLEFANNEIMEQINKIRE